MMIPKYVSEFRCLGSECPDSCCANWTLSIDKGTFAHYRRVVHPAIKPLMKNYLVRDQNNISSFHLYGQLKLRESDDHCPMHSDDKLCSIQQNLGEGSLSDTCFMYPRTVTKFGDRIEQSLTLSCPEAARLALTGDDSFEFVTAHLPVRITSIANLRAKSGFSMEAIDAIRTFAIQLFQTPELTNVDCLVALGWLCHQLDGASSRGEHSETSSLLSEMTELVETGGLSPLVRQLDAQPSIGVTVFYMLFKNQREVKRPPQQQEIVEWVLQGLGLNTKANADLLVVETCYQRGMEFLQMDPIGHEKVLRRYLLNDLIRETFPWGQPSAMLSYRRLLTRFGILRLMLCGIAADKGQPLDQETYVRTVQTFCRMYQHNEVFAKAAELCLQDLEWHSLERLYALLK